jgi:ribosomal subunit interface protein
MQIQINSDKNVTVHNKLSQFVETELQRTLRRFDSHLTRVEVHLSDENAAKKSGIDKRCKIEARPRYHKPLIVTATSPNLQMSISGAAEKMKRQLETTYSRMLTKRLNAAPQPIA